MSQSGAPFRPRPAAFRRAVALTIVIMIALAGWPELPAPTASAANIAIAQREYLIKAAFIYDMIKATRWPKARSGQVVLCVLGRDPFGAAWQSIKGMPVGQRRLDVTPVRPPSGFAGCDALFVGTSERGRWPHIQAALGARPVLTISEMAGFSQDGGMVTLMNVDNRLRFDVNLVAVRKAGLSIDTNALKQASTVHAQAASARWR